MTIDFDNFYNMTDDEFDAWYSKLSQEEQVELFQFILKEQT